jgi:hypothetical protein
MKLDDRDAFVKVQLQDEHQQASAALNALERIGVKAALVKLVPPSGHAGAVVLRIPHAQLADAICSLQYFGFGHVETQSVVGVFAPSQSDSVAGGS